MGFECKENKKSLIAKKKTKCASAKNKCSYCENGKSQGCSYHCAAISHGVNHYKERKKQYQVAPLIEI